MFKKTIQLLIIGFLLIGMSPSVFAATNEDINENSQAKEKKIHKLYDEKSNLLLEEDVDQKAIDKVNKKLEKLGVEFLSYEEVTEKFPKKDIEELMPELSRDSSSDIGIQVSVPSQYNVDWSTYRSSVYTDGKSYNVQRLVAQPNSYNSNLKASGNTLLRSSYNWSAGSMNAVTTVGKSAAGSIPGASIALTVYDTAKNFVSGISRSTIVNDADISYTWAQSTTAVFSYVKLSSQSDNYQNLSYISTKVDVSVGYQYPEFVYSGGSVKPNIIQGNANTSYVPSGYDSGFNAVDAYQSPYAKSRATVSRIDITGLEYDSVAYIYPVSPQFPAHIN
ncbi:hypothetical protein DES38_1261 [Streptohalobacillus salinus]|uniref:Uncharacterized protein n=1 Tax=Streptohalobacillus salinus TaxID=621096 RepID=A0A2V3W185_9BACI|nr:hypothetical protein [Streptohalobacillus salinus]PXW86015.1 hypothetical protein DES38_1261 [Streptohalobacillus salinus]